MKPVRMHPVLAFLLLAPAAAAQQIGPPTWSPNMPLEVPSDPYLAPPAFSFRSLTTAVVFGPYLSVQVNVDKFNQNIPGDAANEPSICVDPTNRQRMAIGWRQFDNRQSNFRQAGYGYTLDGGASWTFPAVLEPGVFRSDPVLAADASGKFYYLSLMETFFDDVWTSSNGGANWFLEGPATGGDKQWLTVDRTGGIGHGNLYQYWSTAGNNYGGRQFSRSTNGGSVWMNPIFIPSAPIWGTMDVGRSGEVYLAGVGGPSFLFVRSLNAKDPSVTPTFQPAVNVNLGGNQLYGAFVNPGGLIGQAWVACDRSVGLPTSGNIYVLSSVRRNAQNPCDVMFSRSTDGGLTFSAPIRVNNDAQNATRYHWFGALSVAPNGRLDVVWNDTRADSTNNQSALYYSFSMNGGLTWAANIQVSPAFNHFLGYPNQNKMGDYLGIVSDNQGASVAYCGTFNGEQDVYYLRIPALGTGTGRAETISMYQGSAFAGGVSDVWTVDSTYFDVNSTLIGGLGHAAAAQVGFSISPSITALSWRTHLTAPKGTTAFAYLYNWATQKYALIGQAPLGPGLENRTFQVLGSPAAYIGPNGQVSAVIRGIRPLRSTPFQLRINLAELTFG